MGANQRSWAREREGRAGRPGGHGTRAGPQSPPGRPAGRRPCLRRVPTHLPRAARGGERDARPITPRPLPRPAGPDRARRVHEGARDPWGGRKHPSPLGGGPGLSWHPLAPLARPERARRPKHVPQARPRPPGARPRDPRPADTQRGRPRRPPHVPQRSGFPAGDAPDPAGRGVRASAVRGPHPPPRPCVAAPPRLPAGNTTGSWRRLRRRRRAWPRLVAHAAASNDGVCGHMADGHHRPWLASRDSSSRAAAPAPRPDIVLGPHRSPRGVARGSGPAPANARPR